MVESDVVLSITKPCDLLSLSRGRFYYRPVGLTERDWQLMEKLDELFTENPTRGTRRLSQALKKRFGLVAGRDKVRRLLRTMGIAAIYPKKNLSVAHPSHKKYPYLLRGVAITCPNQVWSTDISAPCRRGWRGPPPTKPAGCRPAAGMLPRSGRNPSGRGLQSSAMCRWWGVISRAA